MNTKKVCMVLFLLIAGSFSMEMIAQENLAALVKKCETMESVDMNIIRKRNPETKKLERSITSITIRSNPALVNEFLAAFKKDEEKALQAIENKQEGKMIPSFYKFEGVSYSFSLTGGEGNATVTEIQNI